MKKAKIPKALREQVWIQNFGKVFEHKCYINWCNNKINVFDHQTSHNIPESKGGTTTLNNLKPLCSRCNLSMNNQYTIDEWQKLNQKRKCCIIL
jgi:5-methylcytosine-specific restriction endonuclease McrA